MKAEMTAVEQRLLEAGSDVLTGSADRPSFLHAVLCQVGLPRKRVDGDTFERVSGTASLKLRAGELWDGKAGKWMPQPLPYGTKPRLGLVHICAEAVRTRNPVVEIGASIRDFLCRLGLDDSGREYRTVTAQMRSLAACEMRLGVGARTMTVQPIQDFEAWFHPTGHQRTLWPGTVTLSSPFFESLCSSAVPLDPRALGGLSHSALALDVYTWLGHRLHRVRAPGERVSWLSLKGQFGTEYADDSNFRREMKKAISAVRVVYPTARVDEVRGGIVLRPSAPPVPKLLLPGASL